MIAGTTPSGFEYCIPDEALDDYDLLECLNELSEGSLAEITKVVKLLLGNEEKERLKEHLRGENGRVSATAMMNEITAILTGAKEGKNS